MPPGKCGPRCSFNISHTLICNKIVDHPGAVGASPVGPAPSLTAPNHYLNQYWPIINEAVWQSFESNSTAYGEATILYDEFDNCYDFKTIATCRSGQRVYVAVPLTYSMEICEEWLTCLEAPRRAMQLPTKVHQHIETPIKWSRVCRRH